MITRFKIFESNKYTINGVIDVLLKELPDSVTNFRSNEVTELIKKYMKYKYNNDKIVYINVNNDNLIQIVTGHHEPNSNILPYNTEIYNVDSKEFINFMNNPEIYIQSNKYNI